MKKVLLYFPDAVNMHAFIILERIAGKNIDNTGNLLETNLSEQELLLACMKYGAVLKGVED
jgi:hypothetical protein